MKKYALVINEFSGWNQIGYQALRGDLLPQRYTTRKNAEYAANKHVDWYSQFDDAGICVLVCRKKPRKG